MSYIKKFNIIKSNKLFKKENLRPSNELLSRYITLFTCKKDITIVNRAIINY